MDNWRLKSTEMQYTFRAAAVITFRRGKVAYIQPTTQNAWKHRHHQDSHHVAITDGMKLRTTKGLYMASGGNSTEICELVEKLLGTQAKYGE